MEERIYNPRSVKFSASKCRVIIEVETSNEIRSYIASADSALTDSGIWFGQESEYEEIMMKAYGGI